MRSGHRGGGGITIVRFDLDKAMHGTKTRGALARLHLGGHGGYSGSKAGGADDVLLLCQLMTLKPTNDAKNRETKKHRKRTWHGIIIAFLPPFDALPHASHWPLSVVASGVSSCVPLT